MSSKWLSACVAPMCVAVLAFVARPNRALMFSFGDALPGLTPAQEALFDAGLDEFLAAEEVDEGLGPVFNARSCAACHSGPAVGGGSATLETRFGRTNTDGSFDGMPGFGGSLIQSNGIGRVGACMYVGELVPTQATIVAQRRTTPLFGLGLVDAVTDADFVALAQKEASDPERTGGRVHMVTNIVEGQLRVGKFGWKAQVPSLFQFAGDAYLNEMGITNPQFPTENCPQGDCSLLACDPVAEPEDNGAGVQAFADFMKFLAPPAGTTTAGASAGQAIFSQIGCAACHTPTLKTAPNAVTALDKVVFHPYSDFLLHDMGALGDGITQFQATGREMRTAPLWGVSTQPLLLHDGRAPNVTAAILAHDGQGRPARDRFAALSANAKAKLLAFLNSL